MSYRNVLVRGGVLPHGLDIGVRLTPQGVAPQEVVTFTPCDATTCGDPFDRCPMVYAGWIFNVDPYPTPFDPLLDTLPAGFVPFNFYIDPGPDTELCGAALFRPVPYTITWFLGYAPGTDPGDYTADFTITLLSELTGQFRLSATGANDYAGALLSLTATAVQSTCEYRPSESVQFGPTILLNFAP